MEKIIREKEEIEEVEAVLDIEGTELMSNLFGSFDENIKIIERAYNVSVADRGGQLRISGEDRDVDRARRVVELLAELARRGDVITVQNVEYFISMVNEGSEVPLAAVMGDCICITSKGKPVKAKTLGQKEYVDAIRSHTVTLGVGPAGTGKTYLAVALAVTYLRSKQCSRIILTRPAVEAGERLGFLPGDLQNKVDPYLRPLYDALFDMLGAETYQRYIEKNIIEVAPLAYMRGRTLDDSFIILDEAQNTTSEQMKMFLTRLGFNSKIVITGDVTQIDLPSDKKSGLKEAVRVLADVDDIAVCNLTYRDVVRHQLVQKIIRAYESYENRSGRGGEGARSRKR